MKSLPFRSQMLPISSTAFVRTELILQCLNPAQVADTSSNFFNQESYTWTESDIFQSSQGPA